MRKTPKKLTEDQSNTMQRLYFEYEKIQWKNSQIADLKHEQTCSPSGHCTCPTKLDEIYAWEDFAIQHYEEPLALFAQEEHSSGTRF